MACNIDMALVDNQMAADMQHGSNMPHRSTLLKEESRRLQVVDQVGPTCWAAQHYVVSTTRSATQKSLAKLGRPDLQGKACQAVNARRLSELIVHQ